MKLETTNLQTRQVTGVTKSETTMIRIQTNMRGVHDLIKKDSSSSTCNKSCDHAVNVESVTNGVPLLNKTFKDFQSFKKRCYLNWKSSPLHLTISKFNSHHFQFLSAILFFCKAEN